MSKVRGSSVALYERITTWLNGLSSTSIPSRALQWRYSRSRGPGGQNVNKVNSKAELLLHMDWIPEEIKAALPTVLSVKSDSHRSQEANKEECLVRALEFIREAGRRVAPPPTSVSQIQKVQQLIDRERSRSKYIKIRYISKKQGRRLHKQLE